MTTAGPNYPGTAGQSAIDASHPDWDTPNNALADDGSFAATVEALSSSKINTENLVLTNFGFAIPTGATIQGITIEIKSKDNTGSNSSKVYAGATKDGTYYAQDEYAAASFNTTISTYLTFGGVANLFGVTWSASEINASTFGCILRVNRSANTPIPSIDTVRITVTYSTNTAPTITAGPTTTYASGSVTYNGNTWGATFTGHDAEQTGADALTYYIAVSATYATAVSTNLATGTCTNDSSKAVTGIAYNATGLAEGPNSIYLHISDGTNHVTSSAFTVFVRRSSSLTGTVGAISGVPTKKPLKSLAGVAGAISGTIAKLLSRSVSGVTGAISGTLTKKPIRSLAGVMGSIAGTVTKTTLYARTLTGTVGALTGIVTYAAILTQNLAGTVGSITGNLTSKIVVFGVNLTGTVGAITGTITKSTLKGVTGVTGNIIGSISRVTGRMLTGTAGSISGLLSRVFPISLVGTLGNISGTVSKVTIKTLTGIMGVISGALAYGMLYAKALSGAVGDITGTLTTAKQLFRTLTGTVGSISGVLTRSPIVFLRALTGTVGSITGTITKKTLKSLTGTPGALTGYLFKSFTILGGTREKIKAGVVSTTKITAATVQSAIMKAGTVIRTTLKGGSN